MRNTWRRGGTPGPWGRPGPDSADLPRPCPTSVRGGDRDRGPVQGVGSAGRGPSCFLHGHHVVRKELRGDESACARTVCAASMVSTQPPAADPAAAVELRHPWSWVDNRSATRWSVVGGGGEGKGSARRRRSRRGPLAVDGQTPAAAPGRRRGRRPAHPDGCPGAHPPLGQVWASTRPGPVTV